MTRAASRCTIPGRRRLWRAPIAVLVCTVASSCWLTSSAAATVIEVNTLKETAVFDPPGPVYDSKIVGDNGAPGECSLREAIAAANTDRDVFGCPAGNGNDTIRLMPGVYHILDNFFIQEKMTFVGPNKELAGNDPQRGPEAVLSLDNNPFWAAQVAMFWLDQPQATGDAKGAGTVFDGVEMRGGFKPNCAVAAPCEIAAIVQPSKIVQRGYTVTDSIVRNFSYGMYLGGTDTIARNVFEDNGQVPGSAANGYDIYSDFVYTAHDTSVTDNVFKNPLIAGVLLQGGENRDAVVGGVIARNAFLKKVNSNVAAFVANTSGVLIKDNLFWRPGPVALPSRGDSAIRLDKVNDVQIIGNTITGWGAAISIGSVGTPGPPGSTDVTAAFNRIYDNRFGVKVTPVVLGGDTYAPLGVDATDNWWGANGGPGSAAGRPGAASPVNGVQFLTTFGVPVPSQPGIRVDRSLQLTCSAPAAMQTNVPASVSGQVLRMPTVNSTASKPPWFLTRVDPIMAASAPDLGNVFGFGRVPDEGPDNAQLNGTLLPTTTGTGDFLVDLDSERVACPVTVTAGPDAIIDKDADSPTVTAGGPAGYRITVANRGNVTARNWWACDRIPRRMTFVRSSRPLRRLGRLRCLVIPTLRPHQRVSFHLSLRVARHTPNTTLTNIAEVIPGVPIGTRPPTGGGAPPTSSAPPPTRVPIEKARVTVRVRPVPGVTG